MSELGHGCVDANVCVLACERDIYTGTGKLIWPTRKENVASTGRSGKCLGELEESISWWIGEFKCLQKAPGALKTYTLTSITIINMSKGFSEPRKLPVQMTTWNNEPGNSFPGRPEN
eukprot:1147674-Pelagomonas_calceolata.AAC.4